VLRRCLVQPRGDTTLTLRRIFAHTSSVCVANREIELPIGVALFGSFSKPPRCFFVVLWRTFAVTVQIRQAKFQLAVEVALVSGFSKPVQCFRGVLWDAMAVWTTESTTLSLKREDGGKIRVTSLLWEAPKVILKNEVLEVRNVDGVLHIARKLRYHDEWDPQVEPYDPYGPGTAAAVDGFIDD
jgi:hypothetical protein